MYSCDSAEELLRACATSQAAASKCFAVAAGLGLPRLALVAALRVLQMRLRKDGTEVESRSGGISGNFDGGRGTGSGGLGGGNYGTGGRNGGVGIVKVTEKAKGFADRFGGGAGASEPHAPTLAGRICECHNSEGESGTAYGCGRDDAAVSGHLLDALRFLFHRN